MRWLGSFLAAAAAAALLGLSAAPAAAGGTWVWPLQPRPAVLAVFEPPSGAYGPGHRGVDLLTVPGATVRSMGAGVVAFAGEVAGRGVVSVEHAGGLRSTYEPVDADVTAGEPVAAGQPLGTVAVAGGHCLPGTCLHLGLRDGPDSYRDPLDLLGPGRVRLLPVWDTAVADLTVAASGGEAATARAVPSPDPAAPGPASTRPLLGLAAAGAAAAAATGVLARRRAPPA